MPNIPIISKIVEKIEVLIDTYMLQSNGFSLDYGSVNEYDPSERTYPAVFIEYPEEIDQGAQGLERVYEETDVLFRVMVASTADLAKSANWVITDFAYLFKSFEGTLKVEGLVMYDFVSAEIKYTNISAYPIEVHIRYRLMYRRKLDDLFTADTSATAEAFSGTAFDSDNKSIITKITDQIETQIAAMTTANGYNFTMGTVNQYTPASRTYPAVFINATEEELNEEDEEIAGFVHKTALLNIEVHLESSSVIDRMTYLCRSDFDKMFYDNYATINAQGLERAEYISSEKAYTLIAAYPAQITLRYRLHYKIMANNPYHV